VVVALGAFAWAAYWPVLREVYGVRASPRPAFGHGAQWHDPNGPAPVLLGCYHVSQQNTFTGRLTPGMLDEVLARARAMAGSTPG
jgi:uracil-DNA glycosylase